LEAGGRHGGKVDIASDQRLVRHPAAHKNEIDFQTLFLVVAAVARDVERALCDIENRNPDGNLARFGRCHTGQ
jgi:hypothetical protein